MIQNNRVIFSDNGSLTDLSVALNRSQTGTSTVAMVAAEDYIYLLSDLRFNHRYINVSTANSNASILSVELFDGQTWRAAVDVIDQTASSGATFALPGIVSWVPDQSYSWAKVSSTESIAALSTLKIYNVYAARIKVSANLSAGTALLYVGYKFSTDEDLGSLYPEFETSSFKGSFESGKTNWTEQHIAAAEIIISDLIKKQKIKSRNQILNWEKFTICACHQVAAIAYRALGNDWQDRLTQALDDYRDSLDMIQFDVDQDGDAVLDSGEKIADFSVVRR